MNGFQVPLTVTGNFLEENITGKIKDSIDHFIELLVVSPHGSFKADYTFGFIFQNFRYENADSREQINDKKLFGMSINKNNYAYDLKLAIEAYESRLKNVQVKMDYEAAIKNITLEIKGKYEEDYVDKFYEKIISFLIW